MDRFGILLKKPSSKSGDLPEDAKRVRPLSERTLKKKEKERKETENIGKAILVSCIEQELKERAKKEGKHV